MNSTTIRILFLTLAVISFSTARAQDTASIDPYTPALEENLEEYLVRLYTELMEEYILHHNTEPYAEVMLDDYLLVVEIGLIENREHLLSTVGNLDIQSVKLNNEEFLYYGNTAVLVGTMELEGSILGYTIDGMVRYMSVFVQHEGQWRMMSGSFSPMVHPSVLYSEPEEPQ